MGVTPVPPTPWDQGRARLEGEARAALAALLRRTCGVVLTDELALVGSRRLRERLVATGRATFPAYLELLADPGPDGAAELELAVEVLVPGETYFFRDPAQLTCLEKALLPELLKRPQGPGPLTVWSAGCSTGEEAYTLAMVLAPAALPPGWDLEVLGTDLSRARLEVAEGAEYGPGSLRATPEARRRRCFEALPGGRVRVAPAWRERVRFEPLNLLDGPAVEALPELDLVVCRNVLMYFDLPTRGLVAERFHRRLRPGGLLVLGPSENLLSLPTPFRPLSVGGELVYRKEVR